MRTVGEILKNKRLEKKLGLDEVEKATKIRAKYIEAIEKNDFSKIIGGAPTTRGFIKNYAQFLDLPPIEILAVFRRDFRESKTGQIIPHGYYEPLNKTRFAWNPKLTIILGVFVVVLMLAIYLFYQVFSYFSAPRLVISSPEPNAIVRQSDLEIIGKSDADSTVFVNGELVALDREGNFQTKVSLFQGENKISIEAVSRRGQKTEISRTVERESL